MDSYHEFSRDTADVSKVQISFAKKTSFPETYQALIFNNELKSNFFFSLFIELFL